DVLSFYVAKLTQAQLKGLMACRRSGRRAKFQNPYPWNLPRLLRLGGCAKCKEHGAKGKDSDFSIHLFLSLLHSTLVTYSVSLDHFVRSRQHIRRNRQIDLFRRL